MPTTQEVLEKLRQNNAARERAIEPLAEIMEKRQQLLDKLAAIEGAYAAAYREAATAGFGTEELLSLGAEEPSVQATKPRRGRRKTTGSAGGPAAPPPGESPPAVPGQDGTAERPGTLVA